jgi:hypothetical protein
MKTLAKLSAIALMLVAFTGYAQDGRLLQNQRPVNKDGLNVFEAPKTDTIEFDGIKVRVGGDFAMQFQGLSQTNSGDSLAELSSNFNLPTANLNIDVQLADGLRMHLRTYLSSKNHREAYVKGGYIQMDKLDFVSPGFLSNVMEVTTIRVGMDEINYGDAHFRRSDNARTLYNPFVGNYIMDAFTTEPFLEVLVRKSGFIGMLGATNGRLNQSPLPGDDGFALYGKLGYDQQISDDFRFRLTGSFYSSTDKGTRDYLYGGDRAGSRYYNVIDGGNFSGRFNPGWPYLTSFQFNPFIKWTGLEVFGVLEFASNSDLEGGFNQVGIEALYRFGSDENLYIGGRYNTVSGEGYDGAPTQEINRLNIGGGWFLTKNVLAKLEYVNQQYDGEGYNGTLFQGAEFNGIVIEAAISF